MIRRAFSDSGPVGVTVRTTGTWPSAGEPLCLRPPGASRRADRLFHSLARLLDLKLEPVALVWGTHISWAGRLPSVFGQRETAAAASSTGCCTITGGARCRIPYTPGSPVSPHWRRPKTNRQVPAFTDTLLAIHEYVMGPDWTAAPTAAFQSSSPVRASRAKKYPSRPPLNSKSEAVVRMPAPLHQPS